VRFSLQNEFLQAYERLKYTFSDRSILHVGIALSGGIDSMVLLDLAKISFPEYVRLSAYHINHGLQAEADAWELHCEKICQEKSIPFKVKRLNPATREGGESIEAWARRERYSWLASQSIDVCLLAHHQKDQAETFLLQLFRDNMIWSRPLLHIPKELILDYAQAKKLLWVEDPSNQNTRWERNWVRHVLLPVLEDRKPAIEEIIARTVRHCANAWDYISKETEKNMQKVLRFPAVLCCKAWREQESFMRTEILRLFFKQNTGQVPSEARLLMALSLFEKPKVDGHHRAYLDHASYRFQLWKDAVWAYPLFILKEDVWKSEALVWATYPFSNRDVSNEGWAYKGIAGDLLFVSDKSSQESK
jgi:tRNA(Ile)-lysidine synthase